MRQSAYMALTMASSSAAVGSIYFIPHIFQWAFSISEALCFFMGMASLAIPPSCAFITAHSFPLALDSPSLTDEETQRAVHLALSHPELEDYRAQVAAMGRAFDEDDLRYFEAYEAHANPNSRSPEQILADAQRKLRGALSSTDPLALALAKNAADSLGAATLANTASRQTLLSLDRHKPEAVDSNTSEFSTVNSSASSL
jgi:hypothetical protein